MMMVMVMMMVMAMAMAVMVEGQVLEANECVRNKEQCVYGGARRGACARGASEDRCEYVRPPPPTKGGGGWRLAQVLDRVYDDAKYGGLGGNMYVNWEGNRTVTGQGYVPNYRTNVNTVEMGRNVVRVFEQENATDVRVREVQALYGFNYTGSSGQWAAVPFGPDEGLAYAARTGEVVAVGTHWWGVGQENVYGRNMSQVYVFEYSAAAKGEFVLADTVHTEDLATTVLLSADGERLVTAGWVNTYVYERNASVGGGRRRRRYMLTGVVEATNTQYSGFKVNACNEDCSEMLISDSKAMVWYVYIAYNVTAAGGTVRKINTTAMQKLSDECQYGPANKRSVQMDGERVVVGCGRNPIVMIFRIERDVDGWPIRLREEQTLRGSDYTVANDNATCAGRGNGTWELTDGGYFGTSVFLGGESPSFLYVSDPITGVLVCDEHGRNSSTRYTEAQVGAVFLFEWNGTAFEYRKGARTEFAFDDECLRNVSACPSWEGRGGWIWKFNYGLAVAATHDGRRVFATMAGKMNMGYAWQVREYVRESVLECRQAVAAKGTPCVARNNTCMGNGTCDGESIQGCVNGTALPSTTLAHVPAGVCEQPVYCYGGTNGTEPPRAYYGSGVQCRSKTHCFAKAYCTGTSAVCPPSAPLNKHGCP